MSKLNPVIDCSSVLFPSHYARRLEFQKKLWAIRKRISINGNLISVPYIFNRFKVLEDQSYLISCHNMGRQNVIRLDSKFREIWKIQAAPDNLNSDYGAINFKDGIWYATATCHQYKLNIETGEVSDPIIDQYQTGIDDSPLPKKRVSVTQNFELDGVDKDFVEELKQAGHSVYLNQRSYEFPKVVKQVTFFEDDRLLGVYDFQDDNRNVVMVSPIPDATWRDPSDKISWTITPARPEDGYYDSVYEKDGEWFAQGPVNTYRLNIETGEATLL